MLVQKLPGCPFEPCLHESWHPPEPLCTILLACTCPALRMLIGALLHCHLLDGQQGHCCWPDGVSRSAASLMHVGCLLTLSLVCRPGDGAPLDLVQPSALRQRSWPRPPRDSLSQPASQFLGPGFAAVSLSGLQPGGRLAGGPGGALAPVTGLQLLVDSPSAGGGSKAGAGSVAAGPLAEEAGLPSFSALLPRSPSSPFEPRIR